MSKSKIIILIIGIISIITLYNLPKIVVENDESEMIASNNASPSTSDSSTSSEQINSLTIPDEILDKMLRLRQLVKNSADNKKSAIFADSLAGLFKSYKRFDSAASYADWAAVNIPTLEYYEKAGNSYYEAYSFVADGEKKHYLAEKASEFFTKVLSLDPKRLDIEAKIAMTMITTANTPMQGVLKLREILEKDPENQIAMLNLGLLSMQSGQFDLAKGRFEKLLIIDPDDAEAKMYLAITEYNLGNGQAAKDLFLQVKSQEEDPTILSSIDGYLKELK